MKILLLGADGQLGSQLRVALAPLGDVVALTRSQADLRHRDVLRRTIRAERPDIVVNAAAYTAVDRAESEPELAFAVNGLACETLAREARGVGAWLVHYSSDYVFDGRGTQAWKESDAPAPISVYGASKLAGEESIRAICPLHLILRTSWVYEPGRDNFIGAILKAACGRNSLSVVDDQWGTPTRARTIAHATAHVLPMLAPAKAGTYHFAAAGETDRCELARFALRRAQARGWPLIAKAGDVHPVRTSDMPSPARRPLNSRLDCSLFERTFGYAAGCWIHDVELAINEWPVMGRG